MHSVDSDGLDEQEQDFVRHHHYIACKDYDRTIMKKVLESDARLKVDAFLDPIIALENFSPGLYDLLLIDIAMPKMNGFELYDKIRELDKKVKISFVTASEMFYEEIRKEPFLVEKGKTTGQKETGPNRTQFTYSANGMLNGNI